MGSRGRRRWRGAALSFRRRTALRGFVVGAGLCLLVVAMPLWLVGGAGAVPDQSVMVDATPLAALGTLPAESPQFDITALMVGEWSGEMCPDQGDPVPVTFEFAYDQPGEVTYLLSIGGGSLSEIVVGDGACAVDGEDVSFHSYYAMLSECNEACAVDRIYEGHFEEGGLVGSYHDAVLDEMCAPCASSGTWWLKPGTGDPGV